MTRQNTSPRFQPPAPWLFLLVGTAALGGLLLYLGEAVHGGRTDPLDRWMRRQVLGRGSATLDGIAQAVSHASTPSVVYAVAGAIALLLLWRRGWRAALGSAIAPVLAFAVHNGAKDFFGRLRPPGGLFHESSAFPSGHATTSAAVFVTAAYVLWRERLVPPAAAVVIGAAVPAIVAWSRVRLDEHWVTDVLAGWSLGLVLAGACTLLHRRLRPRRHP